ncbi:phage tail protein [Lelliottia nimipressuralis]|uniref:phage tail-collar fiber domain-containing protein n=1 Tax=Lelliottia nimipressuralis TaxID=69220 RepID=UPI00355602CC
MTVKYKTVITKAGAEKLAAASVPNGKKVNFVAMAVGDGGGKLPEPNASQTKLVNEVWRHALNKISQDKKHKNYVVAELVIPPETGGFWLREMGLYDDTGTLIAVGNMAESYKPELAEGSGRAQTLRMVIMVSDIETVELSIDTTLVMATQDYVDDKLAEHEQSRRHPDATLKEKGFTQLSSATDSASEILAATPKAVKAVYDFASAKYTAQDATTAQKGIVQLSSATDSVSESLAATPKAVKTVNDELAGVKSSLGTAAKADVVTSMIDTTAGRVPVTGWMGLGGVAPRTPAVASNSYDNIPTDLPSGFWTHAVSGGPYAYTFTLYQDGGAVKQSRHLIIPSDPKGKVAIRWDGAIATGSKDYQYVFTDKNPDTSKVAKAGDSMTGTLNQDGIPSATYNFSSLSGGPTGGKNYLRKMRGGTGDTIWHETVQGQEYRIATGNTDAITEFSLTPARARFRSELMSDSANSYRIAYGNYGTFWRNDGNRLYLMLTNSLDPLGPYNSLRPFYVEISTGKVTMGHGLAVNGGITGSGQFVPSDYSNFDARYYTKAQSDAGYMPRTGAYTKAESDGRFQPKGSFAAPNSASKAANGWWQCGSTGIIEQWVQGATMTSETTQAITFPKAFPSACLSVSVSTLNANGSSNTEGMFQLISKTNTGCVVMANRAYGSIGQVAVIIQAKGY